MKCLEILHVTVRSVVQIAVVFWCAFVDSAYAEVYQCKLKNGKVEMRDFPCEVQYRSVAPSSASPPWQANSENSVAAMSGVPSLGFANNALYEAARNICSRLMSQYDLTAPMMRCNTNDSNCFSRASQESAAMYQRLVNLPEWKKQQCDLVIQTETPAAAPQGCTSAQIVKPVPFLGTAEEVISLSDGSVWKDLSYKYLYLYAYSPMVQICRAQAKMILESGGRTHTFSLMRLK